MKKSFVSIAALVLTAGSALAADLPSRKAAALPPPPPPPPIWTGFYAGLNAGGTWATSDTIYTGASGLYFAPTWNTELDASTALATRQVQASGGGFAGGGQVGYNYQFYNNVLIGLEADIAGIAGSTGSKSSGSGALVPINHPSELITSYSSASRNVGYIGTVRGRLGWLFTPTLLLYGTGGLAYGNVNASSANLQLQLFNYGASSFDPPFLAGGTYSNTRVGWTAGGGLEWLFFPNWSAKVEYLYYDLGNVRFGTGAPSNVSTSGFVRAVAAVQSNTHFNGNLVRAGVNYHFNWGSSAPIVAKF